jgi:hypothetical protein
MVRPTFSSIPALHLNLIVFMRLALDVHEAFWFDKQPPQENQRSLSAPARLRARHSVSNVSILFSAGIGAVEIYSNNGHLAIGA